MTGPFNTVINKHFTFYTIIALRTPLSQFKFEVHWTKSISCFTELISLNVRPSVHLCLSEKLQRLHWNWKPLDMRRSSKARPRFSFILQRGSNGFIKETFIIPRFQWESNFFGGGGGQLLIPIETYRICDFPEEVLGSWPPAPTPLDPRMLETM